jgi:hypothetical protein
VEWECRCSIENARLGYLFANGGLTRDEALSMIVTCQQIAGNYGLETLSVEDVIQDAGYRWSNPCEDIEPFAHAACMQVYRKWDSDGHLRSAASDWALNLIEEWAREQGVTLVEGERDDVD